jgi:hypothetical protein
VETAIASFGSSAREDDRQPAGRVRRADGVPVHRRAREGRQVDRGRGVRGEEAAGRVLDRNGFGLERLHALEHPRERLLDRQQRRHGPHTLTA